VHELVRRQSSTAPGPDDWTAVLVRPDLSIRLLADETVRWSGRADVSMFRYDRSLPEGQRFRFCWNLVEPAEILITDRRLIYRANTLSTTSGIMAGLREGFAMGLRNGASFLRSNAYVGHVRFDWITSIILTFEQRIKMSFAIISVLTLSADAVPLRLVMALRLQKSGLMHDTARMLASALASDVARYRLASRADTLSSEDLHILKQQQEATASTPHRSETMFWDFPGAIASTSRPSPPTPLSPSLEELLASLSQAIDRLPTPP
jgi:hypothetical protein